MREWRDGREGETGYAADQRLLDGCDVFFTLHSAQDKRFPWSPPSESARRPSSGQMPDTPTRAVCLRLTKTHITPVRSIVEPVPSNLVLSRPERGFTFLSLKSVSPTNALSHDFLRSVVERVAISELCRKVRG